MVHSVIANLDSWHPRVHIDVFQVMPDHIHAIVVLRRVPATTLTTQSVTSRDDEPRATTPTTGYDASRNDEPVGAGPRACPRDETNETPSGRRVAPSPVQHQRTHDAQNRSNASRSDGCETPRRGVFGGSAHPGCRGQARGPAPTDTPHRETSYPAVHVVARETSPPDPPRREIASPDVVQHIKSLTTARYRHAVIDHGWSRFSNRLWQRNYYERIIRDDRALANIRRYIRANPSNWIEAPRWR